MRLTVRRKLHHGVWWWSWQLTHPTYGRCGNGWHRTWQGALGDGLQTGRYKAGRLT